jgi:hypothetical protein
MEAEPNDIHAPVDLYHMRNPDKEGPQLIPLFLLTKLRYQDEPLPIYCKAIIDPDQQVAIELLPVLDAATRFIAKFNPMKGSWHLSHRILDPFLRKQTPSISAWILDSIEKTIRSIDAAHMRPSSHIYFNASQYSIITTCLRRGYAVGKDTPPEQKERFTALQEELKEHSIYESDWFCSNHIPGADTAVSRFMILDATPTKDPVIVDKVSPTYRPELFSCEQGVCTCIDQKTATQFNPSDDIDPSALRITLEKKL